MPLWKLITRLPWTMVACVLALMLLGLSGIARADALSVGADRFDRQVLWIMISLPIMFMTAAIPYQRWKTISDWLFVGCLPLLVLVLFTPPRNGARSWIPLGILDFQPSELVKITFIMALAHYLMYRENHRKLTGLVAPFAVTLLPVALILKEPDLGSAMLFVPVLFAMLFAAGAKTRHLIFIVLLAVATCPLFWLGMNAEQKSRVTALFNQTDGGPAPRGDGYHQHQSKQVLALGGPWGSEFSGMAVDEPLAYHLPAGQTDFVFCLVGERWGLAGGLATFAFYAALFARGILVASNTREPYGRLLVVGIVTLLASQTIINTGMTVGLMPITGITLPLMSYGGSSMLATCAALGLIMNVNLQPTFDLHSEPFTHLRLVTA